MDPLIARKRLDQEHATIHEQLLSSADHRREDRQGAEEQADRSESAENLITEGEDSAVIASLRTRLIQVHNALDRIENGTWGRSVRGGEVISDERLEADPAAELTLGEAQS